MTEEIDATRIDGGPRFDGVDHLAQKIWSVDRIRPLLGIDRIGPDQDDSLFLRKTLPVLQKNRSIAPRSVQRDDQRSGRMLGHKKVIRALLTARDDRLLRN